MKVLLILLAIICFLLFALWQKSMETGVSYLRLLKHKRKLIISMAIIPTLLLLLINICFHQNYHRDYDRIYQASFHNVQPDAQYYARTGIALKIPDTDKPYIIFPKNLTDIKFKELIDSGYYISKSKATDIILMENSTHKMYVQILKPKVHWYDI